MSAAEISLTVEIDPEGDGRGMSINSTVLVNECFTSSGGSTGDALVAVVEALREAIRVCEEGL